MRFGDEHRPAVLSFLLPGLGQLFQGRFIATAVSFSVFGVAMGWELGRWFLPLVTIAAAMEALRYSSRDAGRSVAPQPRQRQRLYAVVGMIGFFAWFGLFAGTFYEPILP